jgi:hypothetical protein
LVSESALGIVLVLTKLDNAQGRPFLPEYQHWDPASTLDQACGMSKGISNRIRAVPADVGFIRPRCGLYKAATLMLIILPACRHGWLSAE